MATRLPAGIKLLLNIWRAKSFCYWSTVTDGADIFLKPANSSNGQTSLAFEATSLHTIVVMVANGIGIPCFRRSCSTQVSPPIPLA